METEEAREEEVGVVVAKKVVVREAEVRAEEG